MVDDEMSNKTFSEKEIEILSRNQYIKTVTIEYHGFDITILGMGRIKLSCSRFHMKKMVYWD